MIAANAGTNTRPIVFIGHAEEDRLIVEGLIDFLEAQGLNCWAYWRDQVPGDDYAAGIVEALEHCSAYVILFSEHARNSQACYKEYVLAQDAHKPTLIVRLDGSEPSGGWRFWFAVPHWLEIAAPIESHFDSIRQNLDRLLGGGAATEDVGAVFEPRAAETTISGAVRDMLVATIQPEVDEAAGVDTSDAAATVIETVVVEWGDGTGEDALLVGPSTSPSRTSVSRYGTITSLGERETGTSNRRSVGQIPDGTLLMDTFLVREPLGSGGMSEVYRADDTVLGDRSVAVKIIRKELAGKPRAEWRFKREARFLCTARDEHIPAGIALGVYAGRLYTVMEHCSGSGLDKLLQHVGSLDITLAMHITKEIALTLDRAVGVDGFRAHRDVKPANIIVTTAGAARLTDYSIALWDDADELQSSFLGSPHYMAPEQILDPRASRFPADAYSLGAVLFEMVTGRKAYPGSGTKDILDAHFATSAVPQVGGSSRMTRFCNETLVGMLAPQAADRFQTPRELLDFLDA